MADPRVLKFLQLLMNRGFVEETPVVVGGLQKKLFRFGPTGALLRKNILKQWWDAVVLEQPNTYCIENSSFAPHSESHKQNENLSALQGTSLRTNLSTDCSDAYLSALKLNNGHLPVSVASSGQCFQDGTAETFPGTDNFLSHGITETQLLVQHYTPPINVAQVCDFWLRTRLRWWKQFSSNPSKFSSTTPTVKEGGSLRENNSETAINYTFPWGTEPVELILNKGDSHMLEMETNQGVSYKGQYHRKTFHPYLIECQTSIERCMSVFLTDAYREREVSKKGATKKNADVRLVLQLHSLLSPYQVAMSATGSRSREVRVLVDHVAKELREAGISVLNTPASSLSMDSQYRRNDELGVPYTVVMSDQTLDTGIITIRNRDTRLKNQQHISKLQSLLSKNLDVHDLT